MTYREALDRVISAAVFHYIDDVRSQPDLRTAIDVVIRRLDKDGVAEAIRSEQLLAAWLGADDGRRQ